MVKVFITEGLSNIRCGGSSIRKSYGDTVVEIIFVMLYCVCMYHSLTASHFSFRMAVAVSADILLDSMIYAMISTADLEIDP